MIDPKILLTDLTRLLRRLEDDLRDRALSPESDVPALRAQLQAEWQAARDAERTAETFESWVEQVITQAGVHWLLSCVFLRFIEDNELVERPWLSGTPQSGRLALARDRHDAYFHEHPHESDRDYLFFCFREAGTLPGLRTFFEEAHNPVFRLGISGDAAMLVMQFWQEVASDSGVLVRDFTDPTWDTRFLGDLYQDLSEATRKRYALLQTPEFVEEFILDRTLTPAIREFGYHEARMIDPTCGSGHFLLGGFRRMVDEWSRNEPGRNRRDVAQKALDAVAGVDLNPFAVAIARFRLLLAALKASDVYRMTEAPDFRVNVAIGDSLLHGKRFGLTATDDMFQGAEHFTDTGLAHAYATEDLAEVQLILGRQYHAVVGNPPYIVVRDAALNAAYRLKYASCHRVYSLGCPFTERFFELALTAMEHQSAGFVGLITTNSFMKREFGSKLIEQVLPRLDLTHVIDTSGAYIPGHGTPTVILFGRHRDPVSDTVRTVMGIKGEPRTPEDPARGLVWSEIVEQIDQVESAGKFVSASDTPRAVFGRHPWSIGGGGVTDLKEEIERRSLARLDSFAETIGFYQDTHADDVFVQPLDFFARRGCIGRARPCTRGEGVRDWTRTFDEGIFFPYDNNNIEQWKEMPTGKSLHWLWSFRTSLWARSVFGGQTYRAAGRPWWDYHQFPRDRARAKHLIAFAFIATHNHFVLDRGGNVFNRSAPVIKLANGLSEDEHLGLLGLLNSSVACFWLQQVCHNKGRPGANSAGADERYEMRYEFDSTKLAQLPMVDLRPLGTSIRLDKLAQELDSLLPKAILAAANSGTQPLPTRTIFDLANKQAATLRRLMISNQEELDWHCYQLYRLLPEGVTADEIEYRDPPEVKQGERAFEIVLARRVTAGKETTTWFERHGATPITQVPAHWPDGYQRVVERRIALIESDRNIGLIERPEYKRRWNTPSWETLEQAALFEWLLTRLESPRYWSTSVDHPPQLSSTNRLGDIVRQDADFMHVAALYADHADFDPGQLAAELVASEAVPFLPVLRYTDTGLRKRAQWENTWGLQRCEDEIDEQVDATAASTRQRLVASVNNAGNDREPDANALQWVETTLRNELEREKAERKAADVGKIPVPPKYQSKDFLKADFWRLRGGPDVPKERWVSYPGCERGADGSLVIGWAGWDHLQQATALATYFIDMKEREGWSRERLQPLLAGLLELVPWLKQWHNDMNPDFGARMGDYYESFVTDEARALQFTLDDVRAWKPTVTTAKRARKKAA
ncbi:hypothetical protein SAMN05446635_0229 [Burkholderia sp. OK233]|nr:hypothetical protein SAMN05446635_0229 [Burkholderia sp. OK233]